MTPKRKTVPKPAPDPRYVLGQLCYLDGTMRPRCRVCLWGPGYTANAPHSPECVILRLIGELTEAQAWLAVPGARERALEHVQRAVALLQVPND